MNLWLVQTFANGTFQKFYAYGYKISRSHEILAKFSYFYTIFGKYLIDISIGPMEVQLCRCKLSRNARKKLRNHVSLYPQKLITIKYHFQDTHRKWLNWIGDISIFQYLWEHLPLRHRCWVFDTLFRRMLLSWQLQQLSHNMLKKYPTINFLVISRFWDGTTEYQEWAFAILNT